MVLDQQGFAGPDVVEQDVAGGGAHADVEVDKEDEAFRLTQPVVSKLDKDKRKEFEKKYAVKEDEDDSDIDGDRFGALFSDERFEVDKEDEAFRLTQPVLSKQ